MFDDSIVIIDEAHNFIGRIVNKLNKPDSISMKLYEHLMESDSVNSIINKNTYD